MGPSSIFIYGWLLSICLFGHHLQSSTTQSVIHKPAMLGINCELVKIYQVILMQIDTCKTLGHNSPLLYHRQALSSFERLGNEGLEGFRDSPRCVSSRWHN